MATPTVDTSASNGGTVAASSSTQNLSLTLAGGTKTLLLGLAYGVNQLSTDPLSNFFTSLNWNTSETFTEITRASDNSFEGCAWLKLDNPTTGTHNITVVVAGSQLQLLIVGIAYVETCTYGSPSTNTATSANPSVTCVDSASGDMVHSIMANDDGGTVTEGGTLIGEAQGVGSDSSFSAQRQVASGASTVCSWTENSSGWSAASFALKTSGTTRMKRIPPQMTGGFSDLTGGTS